MTRQLVAERLQPKGPATAKAYDALRGIGVAARALADHVRTWSHAGLLYRWKTETRLFEMRTHNDLQDQPAVPGFVWVEPSVPIERMKLVATKARLVHKLQQNNAMPYGFGYRSTTFDRSGVLRLGPGEIGLTCSTIVAAILESERLPILDPTTWPPPDLSDKASRRAFLAGLRLKDPDYARTLESDIEAPRIRPEEVVAAAAIFPEMGTFENLQDGAAEVERRLEP